ncbi:hypothetical protein GJV85_10320 [Sulfurimonas aquatica]|uniref:Guanylate cyclase domain-containing protein n=1 Tax=Sulfurimonas aquatica TaxID=2672570 RepID=A0A975GDD9_9BACT|nr:hypothetical protein [Sulfurimonas aquatica]QSZ42487.1 hypothetical protein GJV85_10320 [Sulfurimonas aquatica]
MLKPKNKEINTDIVLIDIINFSKLKSAQQLEIVSFITQSYRRMIEKMLHDSNMPLSRLILGYISTGDGFYCLLNPRLKGFGTILGLSFNHFSDQIAKKYPYFEGVKIAVHTGIVHEFKDILGNTNFIGDGLNDCARYLEVKHFTISTVMISDSAYEYLKKFLHHHQDYNKLLVQREFKHSNVHTFHDKHGNEKKGCLVWLRKSGIINPPDINFNSLI